MLKVIDEESLSANLGPLTPDAPGTYTGDRIEELEEEIKVLNARCEKITDDAMTRLNEQEAEIAQLRRMLNYTDATDDERSRFGAIQARLDEWDRLREIESAAREYKEAVANAFQVHAFGPGSVTEEGVVEALDVHAKAHRKLDVLLG